MVGVLPIDDHYRKNGREKLMISLNAEDYLTN